MQWIEDWTLNSTQIYLIYIVMLTTLQSIVPAYVEIISIRFLSLIRILWRYKSHIRESSTHT